MPFSAPMLKSQPDRNRYPTPNQTLPAMNKTFTKTEPENYLPPLNMQCPKPPPQRHPEGKIPGINIPFSAPAPSPQHPWNSGLQRVSRVPEQGLQIVQYVPSTMEPELPGLPAMVGPQPQVESNTFEPFRLTDELRAVMMGHPQSGYLMRADSEPAGRAVTVIDVDE